MHLLGTQRMTKTVKSCVSIVPHKSAPADRGVPTALLATMLLCGCTYINKYRVERQMSCTMSRGCFQLRPFSITMFPRSNEKLNIFLIFFKKNLESTSRTARPLGLLLRPEAAPWPAAPPRAMRRRRIRSSRRPRRACAAPLVPLSAP